MSSNLTTEPTAEAGPSVAGPSEAVLTRRELVKLMQEKPDIDLGLDDMPVIRQPGTRMRVYVYCVVFAVYHWIKPNGRLTVEEEIESIVCNLYNKNKITEVITTERLPGFYDHLQNSSERATIVLEGLDEQKTRHFKGLGQRAFDLLLENAWAKDRDENLNGLYV